MFFFSKLRFTPWMSVAVEGGLSLRVSVSQVKGDANYVLYTGSTDSTPLKLFFFFFWRRGYWTFVVLVACWLTRLWILSWKTKQKQNKTKQNKTKQKTKQNKTKQNKTKQNKTKQNKTKQNKTKQKQNKQTKNNNNKKTWRPICRTSIKFPGMCMS